VLFDRRKKGVHVDVQYYFWGGVHRNLLVERVRLSKRDRPVL
jgi:hypothetical protein